MSDDELEYKIKGYIGDDFEEHPCSCQDKDCFEKTSEVILIILSKLGYGSFFELNYFMERLYFADFNYYELHKESITGAKYFKIFGLPAFVGLYTVMKSIEVAGLIFSQERASACGPMIRWILNWEMFKGFRLKHMTNEKIAVIENAFDFTEWKGVNFIKTDAPIVGTKEGGIIDYKLVDYRNDEHKVSMDEIRSIIWRNECLNQNK